MTRKHMRKVLVGLVVLDVIYEVIALMDPTQGDTISVSTRELFRTDTVPGRIAWVVIWGTFSSWFGAHIYRWHTETHWN